MKRWPIVFITWVDPHSVDPWESYKLVQRHTKLIESVGWQIHRDDETTILAVNWDGENEDVSCSMIIPRVCEKSYKVIRKAKTITTVK